MSYNKSRTTKNKNYPYKSSLELKAARSCLSDYDYEPSASKVAYQVAHVYNPDFVHRNCPDVLIEVKGIFIKGSSEAQKYISVIRDNPDKELVFVFSDPNKRAYAQCRQRKDGTYLTLGEWCKNHCILYFHIDDVPEAFSKGLLTVSDVREYKKGVYGLSEG